MRLALAAAFAALALTSAGAQTPARTFSDIIDQSPAGDWAAIPQQDLFYMELPRGRVVIQMAPEFAPALVANIRALTAANYFDGAAIVRSQDNYVVQWGRDEDDATPIGEAQRTITPEFERPRRGVGFERLRDPDTYARQVGFAGDFPAASDGRKIWLTHCYGMVGVARGDEPESGSGSELYVVTGQSPRHLDRNIALVGRVLQGIELLTVLPRGTGPLGFYETPQERTPIRAARMGDQLPEAEQIRFEALRTDSATFRAALESRRTRRESWFIVPTGRINVCNAPLPVRVAQ